MASAQKETPTETVGALSDHNSLPINAPENHSDSGHSTRTAHSSRAGWLVVVVVARSQRHNADHATTNQQQHSRISHHAGQQPPAAFAAGIPTLASDNRLVDDHRHSIHCSRRCCLSSPEPNILTILTSAQYMSTITQTGD
jgi:hypothetical protein